MYKFTTNRSDLVAAFRALPCAKIYSAENGQIVMTETKTFTADNCKLFTDESNYFHDNTLILSRNEVVMRESGVVENCGDGKTNTSRPL